MRCRELISDADFIERQNAIQREIQRLKEQRVQLDEREENWIKTADRILNFANTCRRVFAGEDKTACRMIVAALG